MGADLFRSDPWLQLGPWLRTGPWLMSTTILTTKLNVPPPRADWILRPRLIEQLDQGLRTKLTLVSAPAGFGKSTLVTSWLHTLGDRLPAPPRLAWLSLEEDDAGPLRFLAYLTAALKTLDGSIGHTAVSLLEAPQPPPASHVITLLINDLADLQAPCILVLDDFHAVSHPEIETAVAFLLEHAPPHLHLIITTREEPGLPLARLRVQSQVTEIRLEHLRFTRDEAAAFLEQTMGLSSAPTRRGARKPYGRMGRGATDGGALAARARSRVRIESPSPTVDDFGGTHATSWTTWARGTAPAAYGGSRPSCARRRFSTGSARRCVMPSSDGRNSCDCKLSHLAQSNLFLIPLDEQRGVSLPFAVCRLPAH